MFRRIIKRLVCFGWVAFGAVFVFACQGSSVYFSRNTVEAVGTVTSGCRDGFNCFHVARKRVFTITTFVYCYYFLMVIFY